MSTCIKKPIKAKGSHEDVSCSKCEFHESSVLCVSRDETSSGFFVNGNGVERGGQKTRLERRQLDPPKIINM